MPHSINAGDTKTIFTERSTKRANKSTPINTLALEPALESENENEPEAGEIDDSMLDLNPDEQLTIQTVSGYTSSSGIAAPIGLSPQQ